MAEINKYVAFAGTDSTADFPLIKLYAKHAFEEHWVVKPNSQPEGPYRYSQYHLFVKISPDGQNILNGLSTDGSLYGTVFLSTDSGSNWTDISTPIEIGDSDSRIPYDGCMSSDANYILIAARGKLYLSSNGGTSYTSIIISGANVGFSAYYNDWISVDMSDNGQYMYAVIQNGNIFKSDDYGVNWLPIYTSPGVNYFAVVDLSYSGDITDGLIDGNYTSGGVLTWDNNPIFGNEGHIDFFFNDPSDDKKINKIGIWGNKESGTGDIKFYLAFLSWSSGWVYYKYDSGLDKWIIAIDQLDAYNNPLSSTNGGGIKYLSEIAEAWTMRIYMVHASDINARFYEVMFDYATYWKKVSCNSEGKTVVVVSYALPTSVPYILHYSGLLYSSNNYGVNFESFTPNDNTLQPWSCVDLSADGNRILIGQSTPNLNSYPVGNPAIRQGKAYTATKTSSQNWSDSISWIEVKPDLTGVSPWSVAGISGDGNVLMLCGNLHKVYSSYDGGIIWKEECPTGDEIGPDRYGTFSYQDSGDSNWNWTGCSLSYDGLSRVICSYGTTYETWNTRNIGCIFYFVPVSYPTNFYRALPAYPPLNGGAATSNLTAMGLGLFNQPPDYITAHSHEARKVAISGDSSLTTIHAIVAGLPNRNLYRWSNSRKIGRAHV